MTAVRTTRRPTGGDQRGARNRYELIEDVEFLLEVREFPEAIVRRVGYASTSSLARVLTRAGRHDLASKISRRTAG